MKIEMVMTNDIKNRLTAYGAPDVLTCRKGDLSKWAEDDIKKHWKIIFETLTGYPCISPIPKGTQFAR